MREKSLYIISILLVMCVITLGVYTNKKKNDIELDNITFIEDKKEEKKKTFAIMLEETAGYNNYNESNSKVFPTSGYRFNSVKSGCMDSRGEIIPNSLSYNNETNKVMLTTNKEALCYVYFDKILDLNGTEPVYSGNLIPVTIGSDGKAYKADTSTDDWYDYENKVWANAVLLKESAE